MLIFSPENILSLIASTPRALACKQREKQYRKLDSSTVDYTWYLEDNTTILTWSAEAGIMEDNATILTQTKEAGIIMGNVLTQSVEVGIGEVS